MPDRAESADEPPTPPSGQTGATGAGARRFDGVLFAFQGALAQTEDPVDWVLAAAGACGAPLERARATGLADRLLAAGRPGGPPPARIPPHLAEAWAERDLREAAHRAAYTGLAATIDAGIDGLADALYERLLVADGWRAYPDALPTLATLHKAGLPVAVVSNVGFDVRPIADALGFGAFIDAWALSYEVGRCKPDPAIFWRACGQIGVDPQRALMVGAAPADAGAVHAGCRAYLLPAAPPGVSNGLRDVLTLAGVAR